MHADAIEGATYDEQQGGWKYPTNAKLPNVSFAVGDQLSVAGHDLALALAAAGDEAALAEAVGLVAASGAGARA